MTSLFNRATAYDVICRYVIQLPDSRTIGIVLTAPFTKPYHDIVEAPSTTICDFTTRKLINVREYAKNIRQYPVHTILWLLGNGYVFVASLRMDSDYNISMRKRNIRKNVLKIRLI